MHHLYPIVRDLKEDRALRRAYTMVCIPYGKADSLPLWIEWYRKQEGLIK